jgi:NhaP-type Na+/H+ or K+/H+ antiporter/mannitol/fructose-specific phosphotransferase system IIA component (Ntr-type)
VGHWEVGSGTVDSGAMLTTVALALAAGALLQAIARGLNLPVIVLLLLGGVVLGPEGFGLVRPESLGPALPVLVSLAVSLILFEGGLTLDPNGYRRAPSLIRRLLTVGVLVTWVTTALAIHLLARFPAGFSLLAGSLVIVTGPTVIGPLLKRLRLEARLHHALHWEGVLVDPIGVFIAVLCLEWYGPAGGAAALAGFVLRVATGLAMGAVGALALSWLLRRRLLAAEMANVVALGGAMAIFGGSELVGQRLGFSEAGLLAVVVAGLVLGRTGPAALHEIRRFKADVTQLMVGLLFLLLAAALSLDQFRRFGTDGVLLVAVVLLLVRPLAALVSSAGLGLSWRERVFLGWVAPRGIVAASMASLFALRLESHGASAAESQFVETFTYAVIISTVVIHGLTAAPLASLLRLRRPAANGVMVVGAHAVGRAVAGFLGRRGGLPVLVVDTNPALVARARSEGLVAVRADARERAALEELPELAGVGNLLALTDNEDLNALLCQRWEPAFGAAHLFCWRSATAPGAADGRVGTGEQPGRVVWARLPKPSLLAAELELGEAQLVESGGDLDPAKLLLVLDRGRFGFVPVRNQGPDVVSLGIRRAGGQLERILRPELIVRLEASALEPLLRELLTRALPHAPGLPLASTLADLLERERSFPSTLGHGVAVPHAYCRGLGARVCALARLTTDLDLGAHDREPVSLLFLLLSPTGDPEGHLAALAEIARLVHDPGRRQRLRAIERAEEVMELVRELEEPA